MIKGLLLVSSCIASIPSIVVVISSLSSLLLLFLFTSAKRLHILFTFYTLLTDFAAKVHALDFPSHHQNDQNYHDYHFLKRKV